MRYLCHITSTISSRIDADNLRGEPRWERNALAAFLSENRQVHTTRSIWRSSLACLPNFHDGVNQEWLSDSVLLTYGIKNSIHTGNWEIPDTRYRIVNYLDGPDEQTKDSFLKYTKDGSAVAICNWNSWEYMKRLQDVLGSENVEWVQGPFVPDVVDTADNFDEQYLLWSFRNFYAFTEKEPEQMLILFNQLAGYLKENPKLRLGILIGWWRPEVIKDIKADGKTWVMALPCMKDILPFVDRVDVFSQLDWHQILELLSKTKMIISPSETLGCPAYEAAMYGIPTVLDESHNPFQDPQGQRFFSDLIVAPRTIGKQFLESLDLLYKDHAMYRKYGDAYRTYVKNNATYKAFCNQIDAITSKRGWK